MQALSCTDEVFPVTATLINTASSLLKTCRSKNSISEGTRIHDSVIQHGIDHQKNLASLIVHMYADCDALPDARRCLDRMPWSRNITSCNVMLGAYVLQGNLGSAVYLFAEMLQSNVPFDTVSLVHVLCASARSGSISDGHWVHHYAILNGIHIDVFLTTSLITMYNKCGRLNDAQAVFDSCLHRNVVVWNGILGTYEQNVAPLTVFSLFEQMLAEGIPPDRLTFVTILSACASLKLTKSELLHTCQSIHSRVVKSDCCIDIDVINGLVSMYGQCGFLAHAHKMFATSSKRNAVTWNAMVSGFAQTGHEKDALQLFDQMKCEVLFPDKITFINILNVYNQPSDLENGKRIHVHLKRLGFEKDTVVSTALVSMYGRCGSLDDARLVFNHMTEHNRISWNAMIDAYAQHGSGLEAILIFTDMQKECILPNESTFISVLSACSLETALELGRYIHYWIANCECELDVAVASALRNMYAKCGSIEDAFTIFNQTQLRDLISWNTLISSYAQHGCGTEAIQMYKDMYKRGTYPNSNTFLNTLLACTHAGVIEEASQMFAFEHREHPYGILLKHFHCMIDLLGRAGRLDVAEWLLCNLPFQPSALSYTVLLAACKIQHDVLRGSHLAKNIFELDTYALSASILLSSIYYEAGTDLSGTWY